MSLCTQKVGWFYRPAGCSKPSGRDLTAEDVVKWKETSKPSAVKKMTNGTWLGLGVTAASTLSGLYGYFQDNSLLKTLGGIASLGGVITAIIGAISKTNDVNKLSWKPTTSSVDTVEDTNVLSTPVKMIFSNHVSKEDAEKVNIQISEILDKLDPSREVVVWFEHSSLDDSIIDGRSIYQTVNNDGVSGIAKALREVGLDGITNDEVIKELTRDPTRSKFDDKLNAVYIDRKKKDLPAKEYTEVKGNPYRSTIVSHLKSYRDNGRTIHFEVENHNFDMFKNLLVYSAFHDKKVIESMEDNENNVALDHLISAYDNLNSYLKLGDSRLLKRVRAYSKEKPEALHIIIRGSSHSEMSVECASASGLGYQAFKCSDPANFQQTYEKYFMDDTIPTVVPGFHFEGGRRNLLAIALNHTIGSEDLKRKLTPELMTIIKETPIDVLNAWYERDAGDIKETMPEVGIAALKLLVEHKVNLPTSVNQAVETIKAQAQLRM